MKKTLVALAAFAATASFADVTLTGTFDPTVIKTSTTYGAGAVGNQTNMTYNGRGTSQITFKVTEDLGGGLQAIALMENDFQAQNKEDQYGKGADQGAPAAGINFGSGGGEIYTGLTGGFGTIKLGAPNTPTLSTQAANPFGTKLGSGFGEGIQGTAHVRQSQTVNYTSPVFSGLTLAWGHTFGVNSDANASAAAGAANAAIAAGGVTQVGAVDDIGAFYANGPVTAALTQYKAAAGAANTVNNVLTSYNASYTFGAAKVMVGGHTESAVSGTSGQDNSGSFYAVTYTTGATTFMGQIAKQSDKYTANAAAPQNKGINGLGVDYALSKNTTVYARYSQYNVDNQTVNTTIKQQTKTAAGVQVNF